jgi:general secretion pathway protein E
MVMTSILANSARSVGVAEADLEAASSMAAAGGISPVLALIENGAVDERAFTKDLAGQLGWSWIETPQPEPDDMAELKRMIPARFAVRHQVFPVGFDAPHKLVLVCHDPCDLLARQAVARHSELPVRWCLTPRTELLNAIQQLYGVGADTFDALIASRGGSMDDLHLRDEANIIDDEDEDASVVKFVNQIIREALAQKATDIHVEPQPDSLRIRYRIDGFLR